MSSGHIDWSYFMEAFVYNELNFIFDTILNREPVELFFNSGVTWLDFFLLLLTELHFSALAGAYQGHSQVALLIGNLKLSSLDVTNAWMSLLADSVDKYFLFSHSL